MFGAPQSPWRERVRGGYPDPSMLALRGSDQLHTILTGETPQPPISRLTGMRLVDVGTGTAVFEMPLTAWLCSPQGAISVGPLTMPADAAMACALQSTLPPATPFTTSELSLRLLRPAPSVGSVIAHGRLIEARRTIALAEVSMADQHGRLIGHGSSLCLLQPTDPSTGPQEIAPGQPAPDLTPPTTRTPPSTAAVRARSDDPDPWQRPAPGAAVPEEVWERLSGLEVLEALLAEELPGPPIHHLTGLTPTAVAEREVTFAMPASEWLCAPPRGRVQGGAVALLAEAALSAAIQTTLPAGTSFAPVDLKVNYLRPLAADGRLAAADGSVVHAGRRIAVANSTVQDADGKPVAVATGSSMILPDRPAAPGQVLDSLDGADLRT